MYHLSPVGEKTPNGISFIATYRVDTVVDPRGIAPPRKVVDGGSRIGTFAEEGIPEQDNNKGKR